jgi:hypothetical protein
MANQPDARIESILVNLVNLTKAGRLDWAADYRNNKSGMTVASYTTSLTQTSLTIWSSDGDGLPPFYLEISNSNGEPVEEISTNQQEHFIKSPLIQSVDTQSQLLQELYVAAKRNALNADVILNQLLEELNERGGETS